MEDRALDNPGTYGVPRHDTLLAPPPESWSISAELAVIVAALRTATVDLPHQTILEVRTWNGTLPPVGVVVVLFPVSENPLRLPGRIYIPLPAWADDKVALAWVRLIPFFWDINGHHVLITNGRPEGWLATTSAPLDVTDHRVLSTGFHATPLMEWLSGPSGACSHLAGAFSRVVGRYTYTYGTDVAISMTMGVHVIGANSWFSHNQAVWPNTRMTTDFTVHVSDASRVISRYPPRGSHNLQA